MIRRPLGLLALLALAYPASAATYHLKSIPENGVAEVTVSIEGDAAKEFRMPAWAPGDYQIFNYGKMIEGLRFTNNGQPVDAVASTTDPNLWQIPSGATEVKYFVKPSRGNFSVNLRVKLGETFVSGPGVFGWFDGHQKEKQRLVVPLTDERVKVFSDLSREKGASGTEVLVADDYDKFLDAPLAVGVGIKERIFTVGGKDHHLVALGNPEAPDFDGFEKVGKAAADQCLKLFGELPYPRYIFFCDFGGGGGGLEHLNSTRLGLGRNAKGEGVTGFLFHEYFHAFNVKRIRPKVLGPFDYTKPAITGTLWWMEGVTDYLAAILPVRAGLQQRDLALRGLASSAMSMAKVAGRLTVSTEESSRRAWDVPGSNGFGYSYYLKGRVVGICLDLAIRGETGGKHSLDDVIRTLYQETKNDKPGFEEGRIREVCIEFGGPRLGEIYDLCVVKPVDVPFDLVLPKVGLKLQDGNFVEDPNASEAALAIGRRWPMPVSG